ncbi:5-methyltetrahydropteroyltriglutamate--homocysteine methyltransferase [Arthrobacter sp. Hiyo6]|nr:5-methyltetrahydropteroyltriglutamate--homocysteine methyltransferase [Arthrobacter sp. Hiyo6]
MTSIEAARSRMEVVHDLESHGFGRGVGPGVYDIHSPRVPGEQEVTELLSTAVKHVPSRQLWVNPDCGLKTRATPRPRSPCGTSSRPPRPFAPNCWKKPSSSTTHDAPGHPSR